MWHVQWECYGPTRWCCFLMSAACVTKKFQKVHSWINFAVIVIVTVWKKRLKLGSDTENHFTLQCAFWVPVLWFYDAWGGSGCPMAGRDLGRQKVHPWFKQATWCWCNKDATNCSDAAPLRRSTTCCVCLTTDVRSVGCTGADCDCGGNLAPVTVRCWTADLPKQTQWGETPGECEHFHFCKAFFSRAA